MSVTFVGKVLIILSDADKFAIQKPDGSLAHEDTGVFLTELAKPLGQILDAGYQVVVRTTRTSPFSFVFRQSVIRSSPRPRARPRP